MSTVFAAVRSRRDDTSASGGLHLADALTLLSLWLPRAIPSSGGLSNVVVPEAIVGDRRRRMAFLLGVQSARGLDLDISEYGMEELIELGRETAIDHALSGNMHRLFAGMARLAGKVDDAVWEGNDKQKLAEQVSDFVLSEFKEEIDLSNTLAALAVEPPLLSRRELADQLLREQDINPDAFLGEYDLDDLVSLHNVPSTAGLQAVRRYKAGEVYFNRDKLTAEHLRAMKTRQGTIPTEGQIAHILRELPASLDAEFGRRFNAYQSRMSTLLSNWIAARLALHAKASAIDLSAATVTISRANIQFYKPLAGFDAGRYSGSYETRPLCGQLVTLQGADKLHRCFISSRTGAVHVLPSGVRVESWLEKEHELAFEDSALRAELARRPGGRMMYAKAVVETAASGPCGTIREWLPSMFRAEIEQSRESARGMNVSDGMVDALWDLIPFRSMVVALRQGEIKSAAIMGTLDALSLLPYICAGFRLSRAAVKSASPWLAMGMRFGGPSVRQGLNGLRLLPGRLSGLGDSIRAGLAGTAVQSLARLRPLDVQRMAAALRATAPRLAYVLDRLAAGASWESTIPDGVWRIRAGTVARLTAHAEARARAASAATASAAATAGADDAISVLQIIKARDPAGRELALLPYDARAKTYTQFDTVSGRRVGALLVADCEGRLYQTMPLATLERYRIVSPDMIRALEGRLADADGTVVLNNAHYARIGDGYVEVIPDRAVSTDAKPVWRAVAPEGIAPDIVAHRLAFDPNKNLWGYTEGAVLSGEGSINTRMSMARVEPAARVVTRVKPSRQQLTRFRQALAAGMRQASPPQVDALTALLNRVEEDPRGRAIMRAMCAQYELRGQIPEIVLRDASNAAHARPSLDHPIRGTTWYLDLQALESGTMDEVIREFAAVYNNMTGLLQRGTPFEAMLANEEPAIDPKLEQVWRAWLKKDPERSFRMQTEPGNFVTVFTPRQSTVEFLRQRLREMRCYGGLDRATLIDLLKGEVGEWEPHIDLSRRGLDSVPALPDDIKVLSLSYNPIQDWRNLPQNLTTLRANSTEIRELPSNLPRGLLELDVSNNALEGTLRSLPPTLKRLWIARNRLNALPVLPDTLTHLLAYHNHLRSLPPNLPAGLQVLDVAYNELRELPATLPSELKSLLAPGNNLTRLPDPLPAGLVDLDVSMNRLRFLPALPDTLVVLEVARNHLELLPVNLPQSLEVLAIHRNNFRRLPDNLPAGLNILSAQWNNIEELPANITTLEQCVIYLDGNPIPARNIPTIRGSEVGPWIIHPAASATIASTQPVTLAQVVRYWLGERTDDVMSRWETIAREAESQGRAAELAEFLDRLRGTLSFRNKAFRAQVVDWLVEVSKPERKALLDEALLICEGATISCNDRVISTWNDLQTMRRNDDIRSGVYDDRVVEVVDSAREMFRIGALTNIATKKEKALKELRLKRPELKEVDSIEVYLAYVVQLRSALDLKMIAPQMEFFRLAEVTEAELADARTAVLAREREEFDKFLVLDYEPWQTLLKRKDAKAYADAEAAARQALEDRFEPELQKALDELKLDPNDTATIADSRRNLGPVVMRQIRYDAMAPLTQALRAAGNTP